MNIEQYSPQSGRFLKEDGTYINIADALGGTETGQIADIEKHAAHSGRFIKEDGTVINIAESIGSGGGGGGGSSDDSATPIVEEYNGQVIQSFISADRPLQGLKLFATTKQATTTGAQLFDASLIPTTSSGGATVTNNGDGSFTISGEGQITKEGFLLSTSILGDDAKKMLKAGNIYTNGSHYVPEFYAYGEDNAGKTLFSTALKDGSAVITNEILENLSWLRVVFSSPSGRVITPATFFPMIWQTGDGTYEPYTGGIPSPNGDYPQEIQTISDFVVEVKNSMGAVATPQTLNIAIPGRRFYGIPVSKGGNYTDADGQQWICDEFDYKKQKFVKNIGRIQFDGSADESWILNATTASKARFYVNIPGAKTKSGAECLCNRLIYGTSGESGYCFTSNSRFYIDVKASLNAVELLRTYLSTHTLDVVYQLATPIKYDLTSKEVEQFKKLHSYYGTTYIDNDAVPACNMTAEIIADTKLYIDEKIGQIATQMLGGV